MSTTTLEIHCAKPDCHWTGSPAEAPAHECPTPTNAVEKQEAISNRAAAHASPELGNPFAGMIDIHGKTIGEEDAGIAYEADPTDREGLEAWLTAHGSYDEQGVPQDEKTATLDARYSTLLDEADPDLEELGDVTALEEDEPPPATPTVAMDDETAAQDGYARQGSAVPEVEEERVAADASPAADTLGWDRTMVGVVGTGPRPWQTVIAAELAQQTGVKEYRWLVVWHPADESRESELMGRAKLKNDAVDIQEDLAERDQLRGPIAVYKTADVLAEAAEIEKRRENVEPEPDKTVEAEPEEEDPADAPSPQEETPAVETPPVASTAVSGVSHTTVTAVTLFDPSDYEREDLALPKVDGHSIDRIAIGFGGEIMLDRSNPDHVALWRRLKLGRSVEMWVEARAIGFTGKGATSKDGELDVVVGKRAVVVQHVRILGPEDLGNAAEEMVAQARDAAEAEVDRERLKAVES